MQADPRERFWRNLDVLVSECNIVIDRPAGSAHPRYPAVLYPMDYGFLEGTCALDGGGIDVWIGSLPERKPLAIICTVDLVKRDSEMKILLGCTPEESRKILAFHHSNGQGALLLERKG